MQLSMAKWLTHTNKISCDRLTESEGRTYHGLSLIRGIGAQVKNTVTSRKDLRPHTSDRAPIRGAHMKDRRPWHPEKRGEERRVVQRKATRSIAP